MFRPRQPMVRSLLTIVCLIGIGIRLTSALGESVVVAAGVGEIPTTERQALGLLHARCEVCHSADLIIQQRLDREKWIAIVNKMVHWGAQVSPSEQEVLLNYLATHYHPDAPPEQRIAKGTSPGSALRGTASYPTGESRRGKALFAAHCVSCHGADAAGGMGPKLAANPILLENERFWETVLEGRGAMPPWREALSPQEIADILAWLKTLE